LRSARSSRKTASSLACSSQVSSFWAFWIRKTSRKFTMVVPVLVTSCQPSEERNSGPVLGQTPEGAKFEVGHRKPPCSHRLPSTGAARTCTDRTAAHFTMLRPEGKSVLAATNNPQVSFRRASLLRSSPPPAHAPAVPAPPVLPVPGRSIPATCRGRPDARSRRSGRGRGPARPASVRGHSPGECSARIQRRATKKEQPKPLQFSPTLVQANSVLVQSSAAAA
jgi:hypothetical protein